MASVVLLLLALLTRRGGTQHTAPRASSIHTIYEFPNGTWVENLAVRPNGDLLLTLLTEPTLYLLNPAQPSPKPVAVHTFPAAMNLFGVAEYEPDVFAVIAGNFTLANGDVDPGSASIWSVDLRGTTTAALSSTSKTPIVSKIADVPEAKLLKSMTLLSASQKTLLLSDIAKGVIFRLDIATGTSAVVINNTYTSAAVLPPFRAAGVDGLHMRDGHLYIANTGMSTLYKVSIDPVSGSPVGDFVTLAHAPDGGDYADFALDRAGNAYLTTGGANSIQKVSSDGRQVAIVAGEVNSTALAEPTSAAFGRGLLDRHVLYVTTTGGLARRSAGNPRIGGQVVAVSVASLRSASLV